ncbi:ankyrin repeat domain-containing protein 17 isoform X1 [Pieris rapae]|uniref:ankyrin repeat domain-containing protein 17 isoform X1 n=2 Tax=Pieris rapae TaxID=64459 RepID=UPI001E27C48E|nr:ankyrin repeat domain-containing protein 17 isoform X1 [Pieris rapae]
MQNVGQSENRNIDKVNVQLDVVKSSTPQSSASSPAKSETETYSGAPAKYMTDSSESEDDSVSEILLACLCLSRPDLLAEMDEEAGGTETSKFLLSHDEPEPMVEAEVQARLETLLEVAGISNLSGEGKRLADPDVLRRLTSSVSCALDEAAAALTRMRSDQTPAHHRHHHQDKPTQCGSTATGTTQTVPSSVGADGAPSLAEACSDGDVGTVRKLLTEGRSVHETTEEGESLLSLACSAGYYELAQVLLAMHASVEDRGIKGDCTPLMEAASAGHVDIVRLLIAHGADVNAVSGSGNTPLMYACAGGHEECVRALLENGANVEDHNENGHTPLMEAASAGHVGVAKILLEHGAGINTHSNEFKESALTLACYKGHLDMVRFLLAAGADREHKTDEMHTALMEASMDGHVEVARLLLDSGAQVNMPTDSFESPLTLAACGGHVELAMLLLERGANIEEVNDEGYTPLMEAAREGHEEMVALLLGQGAAINAQTDETQETALTLACCGGFLEVADFLIKAGADAELGASTPLMEASQEGHLELVRYLLNAGADVHAQTQTGDTALTYACENGHTDVADVLLRAGAVLEHESEGGRTPLMKACRAGHLCTVQFLVGKGADVNRMTANADHTPLSLACAGGHADVVKFLLACDADPFRKLKDNSSTLIEAAKGGHTAVVQLLLDFPHSVMLPRGEGGVTSEDNNGLSTAQAAALGLSHAPAPGFNQRALLPAHPHPPLAPAPAPAPADLPPNFAKVYLDGRKKQPAAHNAPSAIPANPVTSGAGTLPMPMGTQAPLMGTQTPLMASQAPLLGAHVPHMSTQAPLMANQAPLMGNQAPLMGTQAPLMGSQAPLLGAGVPVMGGAASAKHKCNRKQRAAPQHSDHHLPPPPDIIDDQRAEALAGQVRNESLPETERSMLELTDASGPPTLATSALHALDLQFCAQGAKVHPPVSPPYPPPKHLFQVQQLATNVSQLQLQELQQQQLQQLTAQQQQQQQKKQQQLQQQYVQDMQQRPEAYAPQVGDEVSAGDGNSVEARGLGAVLAYLQREVPSLVALPPNELRTLVLQVMQQKSHELQLDKCAGEGDGSGEEGDERHARRLLAAAEEALTADCDMQGMQLVGQPVHEFPETVAPTSLEPPPTEPRPDLEVPSDHHHHFALPPPAITYDDFRTSYAPPVVPTTMPSDMQPAFNLTLPEITASVNAGLTAAMAAGVAPSLSAQLARDMILGLTAQVPAAAPALPTSYTPPLPHPTKRDHHHQATNTSGIKTKKNRFGNRGCRTETYGASPPQPAPAAYPSMDVDSETDSNHDTALTLACAGGHEELVELLLARGADIEHRDKKGFTPLILAATAGHEKIVEILLNHGADIEAQSERTKDTPLSLACSGGRYDVVELILSRGANKEHRNVSDYTPLSLAASGGYVNIIRLLLHHQAEINSRTGSKLGISPLMLAAMNGHTAAVRLLLDCGSDINAQIETNRNTALTLACFQGRHEVVSLLLDRKANVEHRAKTGLTPLMEAASGGYVEVGRVLLDKGADVNAPPVPSSRDTALTIAADKGHTKFVELLLQRRAAVEVKNKKGNSPLWLAANGGHLAVVEMLYAAGADIDSQDNRKVSCLMAAFRKGHTKVVKWMVGVVTQFPSDQEMTRYICTISDKELLEKCQECVRVIRAAKETQAARANQNATILLEELDAERCREESRRQAAARRRERKKKKKMEKKEERRKLQAENEKNSLYCEKASGELSEGGEPDDEPVPKEEGDSGIDANSQGSCSSSDVKAPPASSKSKKKKKEEKTPPPAPSKKQPDKTKPKIETKEKEVTSKSEKKQEKENVAPAPLATPVTPPKHERREKKEKKQEEDAKSIAVQNINKFGNSSRKSQVFESSRFNVEKDDVDTIEKNKKIFSQWETEGKNTSPKGATAPGASRREEGWKEVVRKSSVQPPSAVEPGCKKVCVASHAISRVIGRAGSNINAIRSATGAHIEVDKQTKGQGERIITIKGSTEATKQAASLIAAMIRDPEADIAQLLPRAKLPAPTPQPAIVKPAKQPTPKVAHTSSVPVTSRVGPTTSTGIVTSAPAPARTPAKQHTPARPPTRTHTHPITTQSNEKRAPSAPGAPISSVSSSTATAKPGALSYTGAIVGARSHTFAAKLTATPPLDTKPRPTTQVCASPSSAASSGASSSPLKSRTPPPTPRPPLPTPPRSDDPRLVERLQLSPDNSSTWSNEENPVNTSTSALHINTTPQSTGSAGSSAGTQEYSLFQAGHLPGNTAPGPGVWGEPSHSEPPPPQVDASKAPGYRGAGGCSPCSRTSSHGSTPPPYHQPYHQQNAIGNNMNAMDMSGLSRNGPMYQDNSRNGHNIMVSMSSGVGLGYVNVGNVGNVGSVGNVGVGVGVENVSRLNPRAPDFAQRHPLLQHQHKHAAQQLFASANNAGNLSSLLMSYQQHQQHQQHPQHPQQQQPQPQPQQQHPYQSLLERGVGVGVNSVGVGMGVSWAEEEERKPRPIGTERAWKLTAGEDWHHRTDHDRYQQQGVSGMGGVGSVGSVGVVGEAYGGATTAAFSLMQALPLHYVPPEHPHWDRPPQHNNDKPQTWSKWNH